VRERARALLLLPAGVWYGLFLIAPLVVLVVFSFGIRAPNGGYLPGLTLDQYAEIPTRVTPLINTIWYATLGTLGCLVVAYPLAYYLATRAGRLRYVLLALVVIPLWTSFLIRTYAWMFILGSNGVPKIWDELGLGRLVLLNTPFAITLGIVYNYLPLMILPLFVAFDRVGGPLREASKDLGAGRWTTFFRVTLPLAGPGVVAGVLLVFIPLMGDYITATVLGGAKGNMVGQLVASQFQAAQNWALGSAMAVLLILVITATIAVGAAIVWLILLPIRRRNRLVLGDAPPPSDPPAAAERELQGVGA